MTQIEDKYREEIYDGETVEGHLGLTDLSIETIKDIYYEAYPESILEIGLNAGHSAYLWMNLFPELDYHSIDICQHEYTQSCADRLCEVFPRFKFKCMDSKTLTKEEISNYDMVFIDGDHSKEGFIEDFLKSINSGVKWILLDDLNHQWLPWIRDTVKHIEKHENYPYRVSGKYKYNDQNGDIIECALLQRRG
jgi:hypothetical protein